MTLRDSRFGNWRVMGYPLPPPPVLENKGFAARSCASSCSHWSYRQSRLNKGVRRDFFGRGGGVGWQMGETSRTSVTDHRSNHLTLFRVKSRRGSFDSPSLSLRVAQDFGCGLGRPQSASIWPPSTWTTALPHPSVEECRYSGAQQQGRRSRTRVITKLSVTSCRLSVAGTRVFPG